MSPTRTDTLPRRAVLTVINPSGNRSKVPISPLPFLLGRQPDKHLVLRDHRISRDHSQIVADGDQYAIEDLKSRHGTFVNGERIENRVLKNGDVIEFGLADSYRLTFSFEEEQLGRILEQMHASGDKSPGSANLAKLRALVEVARVLQSSLSTIDVLGSVVDAALALTGAERGFLLLRKEEGLEVAVARDQRGSALATTDLTVPMSIIQRALNHRRELLSMSFDPLEEQGLRPDTSIANLELRSVVCVPLVRVRTGQTEDTGMISAAEHTAGLLYMDSRAGNADLSQGNRELLQTLALEASTVLENARLLDEERTKQRLEKELDIARDIQSSLLPSELPHEGWLRASGSSTPSHQVGGDYFDVRRLQSGAWSTVVADVSGKGVSSALLAALLQGAFLLSSESPEQIVETMNTVNRYLNERTKGEKYATLFFSTITASGNLQWSNAGHCAPLLVRPGAKLKSLDTTGLPLGMLERATFGVESLQLEPGDKIVIFSDGITDAENAQGEFFGAPKLRQILKDHAAESSAHLHQRILAAVDHHAAGIEMTDDVTLVVLEYQPG